MQATHAVKELALAAAARVVVVAAGLCGVKLLVRGLVFGLSARSIATGLVFELLLAVFVAGPTAALERWFAIRPHGPFGPGDERLDAPTLGLLALPLAWAGAGAAFLQAIYAEAALRTGSTDAGLDHLLKNWQWLVHPLQGGGLCGAVGLTFAACAVARRWAPDRLRQQVLITLGGPVVAAVLLAVVSGGNAAALETAVIAFVVALLLPALCRVADRLAARLSAPPE